MAGNDGQRLHGSHPGLPGCLACVCITISVCCLLAMPLPPPHTPPTLQAEVVNEMPLYPTEAVLFDENQVPTVQYTGERQGVGAGQGGAAAG